MADRPPPGRNGIVIGAMKSGTTTLYHDLRRVAGIDVPAKELDFFQRPAAEATRAAYDGLFRAGGDACRLDISTTYTMWPDVEGVPERAAEVLDGEARLIYLVRDPIERAISHHHHMVARGATTADFDRYLDEDPGIIGYGRYDVQAARWLECFGEEALLVVRLDEYAAAWSTTAPRILAHLGVGSDVGLLGPPARENATDEARVFTGASRRVAESPVFRTVYTNGLRRVLPEGARARLRNLVLPPPPQRPPGPSPAALDRLIEELAPAASWVAATTGAEPWDLAATAARLEAAA